jgi:hypothetical protein
MRTMVEQGMKEDGAFGLSSGLFYVPGTFSSTDEVIELAKVAARFGGIYISHTCATSRRQCQRNDCNRGAWWSSNSTHASQDHWNGKLTKLTPTGSGH